VVVVAQSVPERESAPRTKTEISIVIPVYRSAKGLPTLADRLEKALDAMGRPYEVIFVDDRSPDDSWRVLKDLKQAHHRSWMKCVRLLKNSGQHNALICGLARAKGDIVVTMDDDLQHPPEDLPKLIAPVDEGCDLVVGSFEPENRKGFSVLGGRFVDATLRRIFDLPPDFVLTSLRAMKAPVAAQAAQMTGAYPYVTAMVLSHASTYKNVDIAYAPRMHGVSNYNLKKSLRLTFNLVLNYSSYPLYLMGMLCVASMVAFGGLSIFVLYTALRKEGTVSGWASTLLTLTFSNAVITMSLLILFMYVARMSHQIARSRVSHAVGEVDE
jgi:glycosyltransferase involved in cell wall biosynthesis